MPKNRDERLLHDRVHDHAERSGSIMTESVKKKMKILACMDYIVNNIKNYDDYDFRHAWNLLAVQGNIGHLIDGIDEKELKRNEVYGIESDKLFEDIIRIGVQSLVHAVYPKEWESLGLYLYPRKGIFNI